MLIEKELTEKILSCAYSVHSELGPGLLENVYEECLCYELLEAEIKAKRQVELPVYYKGLEFKVGYRVDILVEDKIILELKTVSHIMDVHIAQLLTYMKLSDCRLGYLINFNERSLKQGIKRYIL